MLKNKNVLKTIVPKVSLIVSDFLFFNTSLFLAYFIVFHSTGNSLVLPEDGTYTARIFAHLILSVVCITWFLSRLRHYTYRKPFWFELKEVVRTLLIFAVLDLSLVAFSKWNFSRWVWLVTWVLILILIPLGRAITKRILNKLHLWKKDTIVIGSGKNAKEAYAALQSEEVLGFNVIAFVCTSSPCEEVITDIPVLDSEEALWRIADVESTQFIVALEFEEHALRDWWLKNLAKHNCRSVSVIPTLRGVPLYGTDMSFIFSHEVMILRVGNNLAKRSSRLIKRIFDIVGSASIMLVLSPVLLFLAYRVSRDGGKAIYGHERVGHNGKRFKCLKFRSMVMNSQEV
ncbi:sugar transferase, partial [Serratia marcescens]|nr:UDP-phosphate galactose phosphotransferase [Serratia marcescens]HAT2553931.1 UDP-phosphate galactose phosphotransferase [Serratia marcescens]HAT2661290.1 UDP-phosphate galactose phosphotransferase [Serratia marcescens]HAT2666939.1 UDP-phosphate galactose phosphotransferase [Serratia marcescens]HAT2672532.1 UDP-phosphate galactose phosphotransferase [Serratia marcescens]